MKRQGGSSNRPKKKVRGWRQGRQDERVTCRPLCSHKDPILGLRSFLASAQNSHPSSLARTIFALTLMSQTQPTATLSSSSSSNFQLIINNALDKYKKYTKNDLRVHPLAAQLQSCDSPGAILVVLQEQVQGSRSTDERWTKWLDPTVNVLYAFSSILESGVSLVCLST